jgi:uncharacterized protein (TIGR00299 family) protein
MRGLYFDCFAGASGDMIVGALIDLGLEVDVLRKRLSLIDLAGFSIEANHVKRAGVEAVKFDVRVESNRQPRRSFVDVRELLQRSGLGESIKRRSIEVFERLARAEARVHGTTIDQVHFHEVGAVDSIVDVVGAVVGFEELGVETVSSSPVRVGHGFVETEHGRLPIPAPGTAELLKGMPVYGGDLEGEFSTPTGAALVATLAESFGPMPKLTITGVGYGAGSREVDRFPNALRLVVGDLEENAATEVFVIETNIDDMNPQAYGFVIDKLFEAGALDVFMTPVQMKKNRPGVLLTALCEPKDADRVVSTLLSETTSLGVRYHRAARRTLQRRIDSVDTPYGPVRVKVALERGRALHFQPEYDDCARIAMEKGVSLIEVQSAATAAYRGKL